jgi:pyridoxamine 5'-phosphate oxidase
VTRSIEKLRLEYGNMPLFEEDLKPDPLQQFGQWLYEAIDAEVMEPNGFVLATVSSAGHPATRTVLLKRLEKRGLSFFTNYESRKGEHLRLHPHAAATFWWKEIFRQVNLEGRVIKLASEESAAYFAKRPRGAQLAALASIQSSPLASRAGLEEVFERLKKDYRGRKIPCPKEWGGYLFEPERVEFWQGRQNRLHDRFLYAKANEDWIVTRLSP